MNQELFEESASVIRVATADDCRYAKEVYHQIDNERNTKEETCALYVLWYAKRNISG